MPYYKKSSKKTKYRKRSRSKRSVARRQQNMRVPRYSLLGLTKAVKLKYVEFTQIGLSVGLPLHLSYRCNGPSNPNLLGAGHQPRGWDQLQPLYLTSCCLGSRITVSFMPSSGQHPIICYIQQSKVIAPTLINPVDALEDRMVTSRAWASGQGARGVTISKNFSAKRFFNKVDVLDDPHLSAPTTTATTPQNEAYWHVSFTPTHSVANLQACDVTVQIEYFVIFKDPVNPSQS